MPNVIRRDRAQAITTGGRVSALMRERGVSASSLADSVRIQLPRLSGTYTPFVATTPRQGHQAETLDATGRRRHGVLSEELPNVGLLKSRATTSTVPGAHRLLWIGPPPLAAIDPGRKTRPV